MTHTYKRAGDLEDRAGFGGLVEIVKTFKHDEIYENDPEEQDTRQLALVPGSDRSDPELVKIDAAATEMEEREQSGHMSQFYTSQWRADIKKAEALYVESPAEVDAFLEKMSIKELPKDQKRMRVIQLARRLIRDDIIVIPPQIWHSTKCTTGNGGEDMELPEDQRIMNRFGFLFISCEISPPCPIVCCIRHLTLESLYLLLILLLYLLLYLSYHRNASFISHPFP